MGCQQRISRGPREWSPKSVSIEGVLPLSDLLRLGLCKPHIISVTRQLSRPQRLLDGLCIAYLTTSCVDNGAVSIVALFRYYYRGVILSNLRRI
jgi:hypothetical protein